MSVSTAATWLAFDAAVPQRDVLLDADLMADRIARLIRDDGRTAIDRCDRLRVNYQIGKSLRVLYRIDAAGASWTIAARTFRDGRDACAYDEAGAAAIPCGDVRPVFHDAELNTVFWVFPNDRKIAGLAALGALCWTSHQLVAYAPEKSATLACVDHSGAVVAYAKFFAGDEGLQHYTAYCALSESADRSSHLRVPHAVVYVPQHRLLVVEAIAGRRMVDPTSGAGAARDVARLGAALAAFHALEPPDPGPFTRFAADRLIEARRLVVCVRPDVGDLADALVRDLSARQPDDRDEPVCLHGDVHPKNAIVTDRSVALIDVEDLAAGPAAADLGSFLAALVYLRRGGRITNDAYEEITRAFLNGYASVRPLPARDTLRWHTAAALFVERVLRAVTRVRPLGLRHLPELLGDARAVLA